jgi:hypothetical protein
MNCLSDLPPKKKGHLLLVAFLISLVSVASALAFKTVPRIRHAMKVIDDIHAAEGGAAGPWTDVRP